MAQKGATAREREIALLLADGVSYRQIGERLSISLPTVKTHVANLYKKLGVSDKIGLIRALSARKAEDEEQNHPKG